TAALESVLRSGAAVRGPGRGWAVLPHRGAPLAPAVVLVQSRDLHDDRRLGGRPVRLLAPAGAWPGGGGVWRGPLGGVPAGHSQSGPRQPGGSGRDDAATVPGGSLGDPIAPGVGVRRVRGGRLPARAGGLPPDRRQRALAARRVRGAVQPPAYG